MKWWYLPLIFIVALGANILRNILNEIAILRSALASTTHLLSKQPYRDQFGLLEHRIRLNLELLGGKPYIYPEEEHHADQA